MRLSNVFIGVLLAIVLAYIHDASVEPLGIGGRPQTIVNWQVFGQIVTDLGIWLRQELDRLVDFVQTSR